MKQKDTAQLQKGLEQSQVDNELHIKELEDYNTSLQTKLENANGLLLQANKNTYNGVWTQKYFTFGKAESSIKQLQDECNMLKAANKEYDTKLWEHKKKLEQKDTAQLKRCNEIRNIIILLCYS